MFNTRMMALASILLVVHAVHNDASKIEDTASLQTLGTGNNQAKQLAPAAEVYSDGNEQQSHPDATHAITGFPYQWQQQRLRQLNGDEFSRQDPSVSAHLEDELQEDRSESRVRREAEGDTTADSEEDDSDMYLEPDDSAKSGTHTNKGVAQPEQQEDVASMGQHFFPSFAPVFPSNPLGHSRPSLFQEPAHSQRPALLRSQGNNFHSNYFGGGGSFRENAYLHSATAETNSHGILGSGNFGVIRGGTFYHDDDQQDINEYGGRGSQIYNPYYYSNNNGHGRPAFYNGGGASNPRPQNHGGDFFANFRDFADINTPTKSSFSQYVVVYVNKNSSRFDNGNDTNGSLLNNAKPKNIIERLTMLDQQESNQGVNKKSALETETQKTGPHPEKKPSTLLSPAKLKLAMYQERFNKQKNKKAKDVKSSAASKDLYEPLLALS